MRAGGFQQALSDLKAFYHRKFTPVDVGDPERPMRMYLRQAGPVPACELFSAAEVSTVVYSIKTGKSTGADGITYERLQVVLSSELKEHLVDLLNDILTGNVEIPAG